MCNAPTRAVLEAKGEWLADTVPDITLIKHHSDKLTESLIQRIHVNNLEDADQMVESLKETLTEYENNRDVYQNLLQAAKTPNISSKSKLEYYELKSAVKAAKSTLDASYDEFINLYNSMPNIISNAQHSSNYKSADSKIPGLDSLAPPAIPNSLKSDDAHQENFNLNYVIGDKALLELNICDFTNDFLEEYKFLPVAATSFLRTEALQQMGLMMNSFYDIYTLQTKSELHANDTRALQSDNYTRKEKFEDSHVFHLQGVCEALLVAMFIRTKCQALPMQIYSLGSQYRMTHTGKSMQSKVAQFLNASSTETEADSCYEYNIQMVDRFWSMLNIKATKRLVPAYELKQHEAAAVEFILSDERFQQNLKNIVVLSRVCISYDFISRRIMAYSISSEDVSFCHFVSGELIDVNSLLDMLA
ncbi:hypothetical protein EB796_023554 [Bugula neritina]|uniref:Uncharacterized protein n=1 Tax=Bugula neritina TaxID=10212 RepID=A0A7J7IW54_BUGNE|nr:hypothetical protein EB796_023554 [Bugula neritina]